MFDFEPWLNLPLIWGGIVAFAVLVYVVLDGFDLGIGILFPFAPSDKCRDSMMNSIAPFWDGNETWLVLGGGGLFAAFPLAFSIIMPALYTPIIMMLIALVFRGVAFEFRFKASKKHRFIWDYAFHFGSLLATFSQGMILGGFVQGIEVDQRTFSGEFFDWLSPFSFMTGLALVFGYALLGSTWLIMKTEATTQEWARKVALYVLIYVGIFMGLVSIWVPFINGDIFERWFTLPNLFLLMPIPIATGICFFGVIRTLRSNHDYWPFFLTLTMFILGFIGLAISLWPWVVPYQVLLWDGAAHPASLSIMLVAAVIIVPIILTYTGYSYYVFRGKATDGYHH